MGRTPVALLLLVAAWGCAEPEEAAPRHLPDTLLRDSLGLGDLDRVYRVELGVEDGAFTAEPATLEIPRGVWVEFVTSRGWPRTVTFELDSLPEAAAELLRSTGQDASPPLLDPGTRFVVGFEGAPAGRYPYVVEGSGRTARGAVVVADPVGEGR